MGLVRRKTETRYSFVDDYIDNIDFELNSVIGGAGTNTQVTTNDATGSGVFGYIEHSGAVGTTDSASYRSGNNAIIFGTNRIVAEFYFRVPVASDGTDTFLAKVGFFDAVLTAGTDSAVIVYTTAGFAAISKSNSVETGTNTAIGTFVANTWFKGKIEANAAGTEIKYWIAQRTDDYSMTPDATHTANINTTLGREMCIGHGIGKTVGATARVFQVDYVKFDLY